MDQEQSHNFSKTPFFLSSELRSQKLCPLPILMPLEENPYTVPFLKALNTGQKLWGGQSCGSTLSL